MLFRPARPLIEACVLRFIGSSIPKSSLSSTILFRDGIPSTSSSNQTLFTFSFGFEKFKLYRLRKCNGFFKKETRDIKKRFINCLPFCIAAFLFICSLKRWSKANRFPMVGLRISCFSGGYSFKQYFFITSMMSWRRLEVYFNSSTALSPGDAIFIQPNLFKF